MAENRFKARQQKRAVEEESRLEQAKGGTTSVSGKNHGNQKMVPVQFYMTNDMKKKLKMYISCTGGGVCVILALKLAEGDLRPAGG